MISLELCYNAGDWRELNTQIKSLAEKRGQLIDVSESDFVNDDDDFKMISFLMLPM